MYTMKGQFELASYAAIVSLPCWPPRRMTLKNIASLFPDKLFNIDTLARRQQSARVLSRGGLLVQVTQRWTETKLERGIVCRAGEMDMVIGALTADGGGCGCNDPDWDAAPLVDEE